jgi:hypothetical protein
VSIVLVPAFSSSLRVSFLGGFPASAASPPRESGQCAVRCGPASVNGIQPTRTEFNKTLNKPFLLVQRVGAVGRTEVIADGH